MQHDWILDVLADIRTYAQSNGLSAVAEQIEDARTVAMAEFASGTEETALGGGPIETAHRAIVAPIGASRRA